MPLKRLFERVLLRPADLEPSRDDFEVVGVFNPGAVRVKDEVMLLVRVAERPRTERPGYTALPRWSSHGNLAVDWVSNEELEPVDPRVVKRKADGLVRLTFTSHLRVVRFGDGRIRRRGPADHATLRPLLLHVCRGVASWGGHGPRLDARFPRLLASRRDLLL